MASGPRVLLVAERFPPDIGGLARSGARTAGSLVRLGARVDVVAWTRTASPGALETVEDAGEVSPFAKGVTLHRLGLFGAADLSMQHTLDVLGYLHARRKYDLVWGHYLYPPGFLAVVFAQSAGLASVLSARGNDVDQLMFPPGDFARLLWTLQRADVLTAASADLGRKMAMLLGRDPGVEVIPNAVDTALFSPGPGDAALRARLGIAAGEAVLGFSGELRHKKGLPFLLAALTEVRRVRPACLLVIGEVRARDAEHLVAYRAEHPEDAARIVVSGALESPALIAEHLRLCDVYLQPSLWEGMPNALLEAMACARPVIASDAGGIPEAVDNGKNGFLVPKALLNHLGQACLDVLGMPAAEREALGRAARARIEAGFQADAEAAVLERVLARARPRSSS
ncbi:glycosyltransferase family 4 protein [Corallococcus praedator]|uniref:Glycosyltransferase family 4 protein n=1 Tax=Corallococcus praedator TaxID=2316724 RepID=A0ABX9QIF3_9BACT|nr:MULTISPECIES: glycosyltransferase [Corallococcus]RKH29639.1 glycosyltransferase family 4 protein [Corallococcus sp. CA031C]RKI08256.1 glycosyltransferase family 4 protein [Corallococcus praedator]